jgi:beta-lactam-binding protein with PASTA domain
VADGVVTLRIRTQRLAPGDRLIGRVLEQSIPPGVAIDPGTTMEVVVGTS